MEIHEEMIADTVRTEAFRKAIHEMVSRRVVIDVGAGTGILSIYAVEAGAKHVYAIEASNIVKVCRDRIHSRGLQNQIEIMHSRAEDVTWLQHQADVIVSEWIGYFLLFERMLPSVLAIRDRHLKENGAMIP
jgi:predicted RNA methylase